MSNSSRLGRTSGVDDEEAREKIFHLMQALGAVKGYFQSVVEDGKMAQAQLDEFQALWTHKLGVFYVRQSARNRRDFVK